MRSTLAARILGVLLALAVPLACSRPSPEERGPRRGVLVIAIDGWRTDHLSLYGYDRQTSPFLDELARESIVFDRAYAPSPEALPVHASLLSGCAPEVCERPPLPDGMVVPSPTNVFLPERLPRLGRSFLVEGFRTAAFSDHPWLSPVHGFRSGFEKFSVFREEQVRSVANFGFPGVANRFKTWLKQLGPGDDWFAYLQITDLERIWGSTDPAFDDYFQPRPELDFVPAVSALPRAFFAVPRRHWSGGSSTLGDYEAKYDGNLREIDQNLGRLCDWLERRGYWDDLTLLVVGTYGMGFGEAGMILDSGTLDDVDLRVPFVLRPAPALGIPPKRFADEIVSLVDVAPTLLDLCGLEQAPGMHGLNLGALLRGQEGASGRQIAFASGGVHDGFRVWTQDSSYASFVPAGRSDPGLRSTWTGTDSSVRSEPVRELLGLPERTRLDLKDEAHERLADRLAAEAAEHFRWLSVARDAIHPAPWRDEGPDEGVLRELEQRGLIAPQTE